MLPSSSVCCEPTLHAAHVLNVLKIWVRELIAVRLILGRAVRELVAEKVKRTIISFCLLFCASARSTCRLWGGTGRAPGHVNELRRATRSGFRSRGLQGSFFRVTFRAEMEGLACSMGPSGDCTVLEQRNEASNSSSTEILSSRGEHGEGAEGTARAQKKRKDRSDNWSEEQTEELLNACSQLKEEKGRFRMCGGCRPSYWETVSRSVRGRTPKECQWRMDTLTKSWRVIKVYCDDHHKEFGQLTQQDFQCIKQATAITGNWYNQICEMKMKPKNPMVVTCPDLGDGSISSSSALASVLVCCLSRPQQSVLVISVTLHG